MFRHRPGLRIALALLVVLAMGIAAPIHAAHHHGDAHSLHSECTLCQSLSPACQPLLEPGVGISPEPVSTFALASAPSVHATAVVIAGTRAPPSLLA